MNLRKNRILKAIRTKYQSDIELIDEELNVYIDNPVGIGEHGDLTEVIEEKIEKIDNLKSKIETIDSLLDINSGEEKLFENKTWTPISDHNYSD